MLGGLKIQLLVAAGVGAIAIGTPVMAQETGQAATTSPSAPSPSDPLMANVVDAEGTPDQTIDEGEIVVTAQKRVERLLDVPLAVTAIGGNDLATRNITDTAGLTQAVPSLTFQQGANPTNTSLRIRGVGTSLFGQGVEPSVSVVVDGVVAARAAQGFSDFADIERVEVLRGPQGTLFGRNASAGVVNVVTARPTRDFQGRIDATVAELDEYRVKGTVSGPISETLRARVTGFYNNVGGHVRNITTGRDVNGFESWGVRGKLEWDASDSLNLLLTGSYSKNNSDCCASTYIRVDNPVVRQLLLPVTASPRNRTITEDTDTYANSRQIVGSLQADWDLGPATITSITAYQRYDLDVNQPIDRLNTNPIPFVGTGAPYASWNLNRGQVKLDNFSQELRIGSNGASDLTYVAGIFYTHLEITRPFERRRAVCRVGVIGQPCAAPIFQSASSIINLNTESISAFGQAEYRIVGGLKAIGGLRLQYETGTNSGTRTAPIVAGDVIFPSNPPSSGSFTASDTALTGKAGLQYEFSRNLQAYATYTRGYKGQGYEMEISADLANQDVLEPENVDAYEIGLKGRTRDGSLSFSAALFQADYTNLQVQANRSDPTTGVVQFVATNAGTSRSRGFELEATLRPSRGFSINAGFTLAESTINIDGLNCPLQLQAGAPVLTGAAPINRCYRPAAGATPTQNLRGATLPVSPRYRLNLSPRYESDIAGTDLSAFAQMVVGFQSEQQFAVEQDPLLVQPAYTLVDATIGFGKDNGRYNLSLFVKNLFNEYYFTDIRHGSLLATVNSPNDLVATFNKDSRRYFGASFGMKF